MPSLASVTRLPWQDREDVFALVIDPGIVEDIESRKTGIRYKVLKTTVTDPSHPGIHVCFWCDAAMRTRTKGLRTGDIVRLVKVNESSGSKDMSRGLSSQQRKFGPQLTAREAVVVWRDGKSHGEFINQAKQQHQHQLRLGHGSSSSSLSSSRYPRVEDGIDSQSSLEYIPKVISEHLSKQIQTSRVKSLSSYEQCMEVIQWAKRAWSAVCQAPPVNDHMNLGRNQDQEEVQECSGGGGGGCSSNMSGTYLTNVNQMQSASIAQQRAMCDQQDFIPITHFATGETDSGSFQTASQVNLNIDNSDGVNTNSNGITKNNEHLEETKLCGLIYVPRFYSVKQLIEMSFPPHTLFRTKRNSNSERSSKAGNDKHQDDTTDNERSSSSGSGYMPFRGCCEVRCVIDRLWLPASASLLAASLNKAASFCSSDDNNAGDDIDDDDKRYNEYEYDDDDNGRVVSSPPQNVKCKDKFLSNMSQDNPLVFNVMKCLHQLVVDDNNFRAMFVSLSDSLNDHVEQRFQTSRYGSLSTLNPLHSLPIYTNPDRVEAMASYKTPQKHNSSIASITSSRTIDEKEEEDAKEEIGTGVVNDINHEASIDGDQIDRGDFVGYGSEEVWEEVSSDGELDSKSEEEKDDEEVGKDDKEGEGEAEEIRKYAKREDIGIDDKSFVGESDDDDGGDTQPEEMDEDDEKSGTEGSLDIAKSQDLFVLEKLSPNKRKYEDDKLKKESSRKDIEKDLSSQKHDQINPSSVKTILSSTTTTKTKDIRFESNKSKNDQDNLDVESAFTSCSAKKLSQSEYKAKKGKPNKKPKVLKQHKIDVLLDTGAVKKLLCGLDPKVAVKSKYLQHIISSSLHHESEYSDCEKSSHGNNKNKINILGKDLYSKENNNSFVSEVERKQLFHAALILIAMVKEGNILSTNKLMLELLYRKHNNAHATKSQEADIHGNGSEKNDDEKFAVSSVAEGCNLKLNSMLWASLNIEQNMAHEQGGLGGLGGSVTQYSSTSVVSQPSFRLLQNNCLQPFAV